MAVNLITVRAKIGKCIYRIEMDQKSCSDIEKEIIYQLDLKSQKIEILEIYDKTNPKSTRPYTNGNTNAHTTIRCN